MNTEQAVARQAAHWAAAERLRSILARLVEEVNEVVVFPADSDLGAAMREARRELSN